jgi:hypothetical protein
MICYRAFNSSSKFVTLSPQLANDLTGNLHDNAMEYPVDS